MIERAVLQRVGRVAGLLEVAVLERVLIDDQQPAGDQVLDVGLEGRRVHRDEDAGLVARGEDVVVREVDLEGGDAGERSGRGPDLGRVVGERREVVPEEGAGAREAISRQLHPVAGVAGESDHYSIYAFPIDPLLGGDPGTHLKDSLSGWAA